MAIFQETHPKTEDPIVKHEITLGEVRFLKKLQHELNVQDSMGNRDPKFWVIKQSKDKITSQDTEPFEYDYVVLSDDDDLSQEIKTLDELFDAMQRLADDGSYQYNVERTPDGILITNEDDGSDFTVNAITAETADILDTMAGDVGRFHVNYVTTESSIVPDTLFLTHESCEEHLMKYGYNYEPDAHAYAMTADRSPEYEALIKILRTVDFEKLRKLVKS